jgi:bacteriocin biosynthesis cyclodehydratase domain-containing protein
MDYIMLAQSMRPKFKADVDYISVSNGVYLRGYRNNLLLKGKSLYALIVHLVPHLNGEATLAEITEGLDEERKKMVTNLVAKLLAHDFLQDTGSVQQPTPDMAQLTAYAPNITFINSFQASAAQWFEAFRNKQLLLIGSGLSLDALMWAGVRCGVKRIGLLRVLEDESAAQSLQKIREFCADEQIIRLIDAPSWDNENDVRALIQPYDAVVYIAERPTLARARLLNRLCIEQQKLLNQAVLVDGMIWAGPLVSSKTGACWECAWRRLYANLPAEQRSRYEFQDQPQSLASQLLTRTKATMIGSLLMFGVFRYFTQAGSTEMAENLTAIDLVTGVSEDHTFLPHPHCRSCQRSTVPTAAQFLEQVQQSQRQEPIDSTVFLENFATCVDERVGIFTAVDDHFAQVPLATYKVCLSHSRPPEPQGEPISVVAVDLDARDAIIRAAQKAYVRYAATTVDRRRLLSAEMAQQHPLLTSDQLMGGETSSSEGELWTWAMDMQTLQAVLVPATHVFSSDERGIAVGMSWDEAVCRALLDWCNLLTVEQMREVQQVDLLKMPMTSEGNYLYQLLKTAGEQVTAYDVTGVLQIPTFALYAGEQVVAYSTDYDAKQALRKGLEQVLWWHQAQHTQNSDNRKGLSLRDYPAVSVPALPPVPHEEQLSTPAFSAAPETWLARKEWLLQKMWSHGMRVFVVPLDHDPTLARMVPFIVRVLVSGKELQEGE